jgi:hypothetical protein
LIRYVRHNEINKERWDNCIASSPQGVIYAYSWYLDIVSPFWEALIEDDYTAVFPLTCRKKFGISYLFQPFFNQQLGLFCKDEIVPENKLREFLTAIPGKFKLIEIQLNHSNKLNAIDGFSLFPKLTHHLELSYSYQTITGNYSENLGRNLKKAKNSGMEILNNIPPENIVKLFRENRGAGINVLKDDDYENFLQITTKAGEWNLMYSKGINNSSGNLIAGAVFIKSTHSYIFLFSATNKEARDTGAMSALIDSFIMEHSTENLLLDFEGSMDENLARFYKSFGSKEIVYLQIRKNNLPFLIRWIK